MLQYTDLENYGKYIVNKINGLLKLNERSLREQSCNPIHLEIQ